MSGFPVPLDIVFLALLAVALGWRLYVVIGRRVKVEGAEAFYRKPFLVAKGSALAEPVEKPAETRFDIPQPGTRVGQALSEIRQKLEKFEPLDFAEQSGKIFRTIVSGYADGNLAALSPHSGADMLAAFEAAISARVSDGQTQVANIVALEEVSLVDAGLIPETSRAPTAFIDVRFLSRQINFLHGESREIVHGTESVTEFSELWRFEHIVSGSSQTNGWRVTATRAA